MKFPNPRHASSRLVAVLALVAAAALLAPQTATAQTPVGNGRVTCDINDPDGNPVANAAITLTYLATGDTLTDTTNEAGRFQRGGLGSGRWRVDVVVPGFINKQLDLTIRDRSNERCSTVMEPGDSSAIGGPTVTFGGELGKRVTAANEIYATGDYQGALTEFQAILTEFGAQENAPANLPLVNVNAGNAAMELSNFEAAARHFGAAVQAMPTNQDARMGLARAHMMNRDLDAALAELEQIDLVAVTDPVVFFNIGQLLFNQGQAAPAQRYYEMAVERNPEFGDAHMQIGFCLVQQGMMMEAKPHFERVIEIDPESQNAAIAQDFLNTIG